LTSDVSSSWRFPEAAFLPLQDFDLECLPADSRDPFSSVPIRPRSEPEIDIFLYKIYQKRGLIAECKLKLSLPFNTPVKLADPMTLILKLIALIVSISLVFDSIHKIFVCIEKVNTHFLKKIPGAG